MLVGLYASSQSWWWSFTFTNTALPPSLSLTHFFNDDVNPDHVRSKFCCLLFIISCTHVIAHTNIYRKVYTLNHLWGGDRSPCSPVPPPLNCSTNFIQYHTTRGVINIHKKFSYSTCTCRWFTWFPWAWSRSFLGTNYRRWVYQLFSFLHNVWAWRKVCDGCAVAVIITKVFYIRSLKLKQC